MGGDPLCCRGGPDGMRSHGGFCSPMPPPLDALSYGEPCGSAHVAVVEHLCGVSMEAINEAYCDKANARALRSLVIGETHLPPITAHLDATANIVAM